MKSNSKLTTLVILSVLVSCADCLGGPDKTVTKAEEIDFAASKRTFFLSKLLLIPTLAAIGLKFLVLLPIFLSKIALLGMLNFISANLNLLLSAIVSVKNYFATNTTKWNEDHRQVEYEYYYPEYQTTPTRYENIGDVVSVYHQYHPPEVYFDAGRQMDTMVKRSKKLQVEEAHQDNGRGRVGDEDLSKTKNPGKYRCYWTHDTTQDTLDRTFYDQVSMIPGTIYIIGKTST